MNKLLVFLFFANFLIQDFSGFNTRGKINENVDFITTDQLGNVYLIKNNRVSKYDKSGKFERSYSNSLSGNISSVDVSDPLRIMIYFADFNQIVFLDNTLSALNEQVMLDDYELEFVTTACTSTRGGFWVYDRLEEGISYFDKNMERKVQSLRITGISDFENHPDFILESDKKIFLAIPEHGIMMFDLFGSKIRTIPLKNINNFQVIENQIVYFENKTLVFYDYNLQIKKELKIPLVQNLYQVRIEGDNIYLGGPDFCYIVQKID